MDRAALRAKVFQLGHEPRVNLNHETTAAERLALVAELSREMWALTGREIPAYSRSEMPVAVVFLKDREG